MASDVQTGTATLKGISNSGSAITITGYATFLLSKAGLKHHFRLAEIQDAGDFDANLTATNENFEVEIDFTISGATRAAAAATAVLPTPLTSITLANFKISLFNTTYVYIGDAAIDLSNTEAAKFMGMRIRHYADSTQNTSLNTTISG